MCNLYQTASLIMALWLPNFATATERSPEEKINSAKIYEIIDCEEEPHRCKPLNNEDFLFEPDESLRISHSKAAELGFQVEQNWRVRHETLTNIVFKFPKSIESENLSSAHYMVKKNNVLVAEYFTESFEDYKENLYRDSFSVNPAIVSSVTVWLDYCTGCSGGEEFMFDYKVQTHNQAKQAGTR